MLDIAAVGWAFVVALCVAVGYWLASILRSDVGIADSVWSLLFLVMLAVYQYLADTVGPRHWLVLALVAIWALRLSIHITARNHGRPEDRRYRLIRRNNAPYFRYKSLYIVFGLQACLAGFIAMPLLVASSAPSPLGWLDVAGTVLWSIGMLFEVLADLQLARFKAKPENRGKVLDTGLWAFTRHPNYFGEFAIWWGYFLLALAAGGWWTVFSPLLMSFLLLKITGVALLEKDIGERRPEYADYIRRTNAFFPGPPRDSV
jgi:steroid 5-alpha reductase family enzyme